MPRTDVMPSIEDMMVLFVVPFLEYLLYPHLRRSMGIEVRPIHKASMQEQQSFICMFSRPYIVVHL